MNENILELVPADDPLITTELEKFTLPSDDAWQLVLNMIATMRAKKGIGLAANQVGSTARMFVMDGAPPLACFNPRIVDVSEEEILLEEACLTFPGLSVKIKRPKIIKVRYQDADGAVHTEKLTGMTARIFQHELDHLNGIRFYDRADRYHRDQAMRRWKSWRRKNV